MFQVRKVSPFDTLVFPASHPRIDRNVRNRVLIAGDELLARQLPVHHPVQPLRFIGVAIEGVFDLFGRIFPEMMSLAQHRPDTSHLEHQPLQHLKFQPVSFR